MCFFEQTCCFWSTHNFSQTTQIICDKERVVTVSNDRLDQWVLHPIHGALLAGTIPLFLGGLLSDFAYSSSYHIQWANFAAWLIAGGLVFGGFALVWSIVHLVRHRGPFAVIYPLLLLTTWILGLLNSLIHAKDA